LEPLIEVREAEMPSASERAVLGATEGGEVIRTTVDASGRPVAIWVRWRQVPDFYGSGPRDRHYVLDHLTGEIRFGNGQQGMVPPRGRNNIRAALYRTGGGVRGNQPAGVISQLKSTVPYIDGVINLEAAGGGAAQETLERVKERGPRSIRHRNRATTLQDFADLAQLASTDVARVHVLAAEGYDNAGRVGLILVPQSTEARPVPSLDLISRVEAYILAHAAPTVDLWLAGPDWVQVTVVAEIVPESLEIADAVETDVSTALQRFLHPLTGGSDGQGWAFGRRPHRSDLYALIESIPGVDYVRTLSVEEEEIGVVQTDHFLVFSGSHEISLVSPDEEV
jgi:predicted phage baseplate assembly protein